MKKKDLKLNMNNVDKITIDMDAFGESLLLCAPRVREFCGYIDSAVSRIAFTQFEKYVDTLDQCNDIIDSIYAKQQLIRLNKVVATWYKALPDRQKRIFKSYFVDKKNGIKPGYQRVTKYRRDRHIIPMIHSFMGYLRPIIDFNEKELINNYYVYDMYEEVLERQLKNKKSKHNKKKGEKKHDNSANERCHCCRV